MLVRLVDEQRANLAPPAATSPAVTIDVPKYASKIEAQMCKPLGRAAQVYASDNFQGPANSTVPVLL